MVSAVLIRKEHEQEAASWVARTIGQMNSPQMKNLHFRRLRPAWRKEIACRELANLPVRCFVVCSNKKNMRGYQNPFAAQVPSQNWFYCWMTRVLLERVTHFVGAHSRRTFSTTKRVKLVYSKAGGLRYSQMAAYYEWIKQRRRNDNQVLFWGDLEYDTISSHLLEVKSHDSEPRLAMPDIVASAFMRATDKRDTPCNSSYAKLLRPRMATSTDTRRGQISGYGVKLLPSWPKAKLESDQQEIFRFYGYPRQWWDNRWVPDPFAP